MSLASRLTALATAIGTDIKSLTETVQGKSTWYAGAGAPGSGLGQQGDWYMDQFNGKIYHKNPAWALAAMPPGLLVLDTVHVVGAGGEPAYVNSWGASGAGTYGGLKFRKDPFGNVRVQGAIVGGASGSTVFTLPAGYLPATTKVLPNLQSGGAAGTYVTVTAAGLFQVTYTAGPIFIDVEFDTESVAELVVGSTPKQELPAVVTVLPSSPTEGQLVRFQTAAMAAASVSPMLLSYRSAQSGAYKWDVLGGGRMGSTQTAASTQSTANFNTYTALNNGPTIVAPISGVYDVDAWGPIYRDTAPLTDTRVAIAIDSTGQGQIAWDSRAGAYEAAIHHGGIPGLVANAGQTFHLMLSTSNVMNSFGNPVGWRMVAHPIRVG